MELTLPALEDAVWQELTRATREKGHAWRHAVLATVDGEAADARTVVLRDAERGSRTLLIYTDARSPKAAQLAARPLGTLVLWSPQLSWQLRLRVRLALETNGLRVSSRWAQLRLTPAAQDYMAPLPPGSPLGAPTSQRHGREHFAVLAAEVVTMDWLLLAASGHRRARFDAAGGTWVTP